LELVWKAVAETEEASDRIGSEAAPEGDNRGFGGLGRTSLDLTGTGTNGRRFRSLDDILDGF
jgi:hypothetical protein